MRISYKSSVKTNAGWRAVRILAEAEPITAKTARVLRVLEIDGEAPAFGMPRTGAKRQQYNGHYFASAETGKRKILSACEVLAEV